MVASGDSLFQSDIYETFGFEEATTIADNFFEVSDMLTLRNKLEEVFTPTCKKLHVKRIQCEMVSNGEIALPSLVNMNIEIYEAEGPEFNNVMYECQLPGGVSVQTSISYTDFNISDAQLREGRTLCEIIGILISRNKAVIALEDEQNRDPITGIANTKAFFAFGEKLFNSAKIVNYDVLTMNIRNFKYVNHVVPFNTGTSVMVRYARALVSFLKGEELVARAGGDTFFILVKKENVKEYISNVKSIAIDIKDGGRRFHFDLGSYIGVYSIDTRIGIHSAIECANNARAVAKRKPHNPAVFYTEEMGEREAYDNRILAEFDQAMLNREFVAYYQPKVNVKTQKIIGMEALVRWVSGYKVYSPQKFVGILENSSKIFELDRCMLRQVCRDINRWERMGIDVPRISVNFSRRNLTNPNIAKEVASVLDEYHVDHSKVEIEVTETVDSEAFASLISFIDEMKKYDIKVSIDDFGTGYSSLHLLRRLNADVLKIDRSFINLEKFAESDELLVGSIIKLAKAYNMEVITEGVETIEQIEFLKKVGCENVQGYFFDKPLSKEDVTAKLSVGHYEKEL